MDISNIYIYILSSSLFIKKINKNLDPYAQSVEIIFVSDLREPFSLQKGWLLWAGIGLVGAISAVALTGAATSFFSGESPQREVRN
jgi:hypothetical protein